MMFNIKDRVQNDTMDGNDDLCNFGNCEFCGAGYKKCSAATLCECFNADVQPTSQWLEDALSDILERDPNFQMELDNARAENLNDSSVRSSNSSSSGVDVALLDEHPVAADSQSAS